MKHKRPTILAGLGALLILVLVYLVPGNLPVPHRENMSVDIRDTRENCRLLGIVSPIPPDIDAITTVLKGFSHPSYPQSSGWSLAAYSNYESGGYLGIPNRPMIIRTQTPILNDRHTWNTVSNLVTRLEPEVIIGHLRNASSGCSHIADPHPFEREYNGRYYLMIHNGGIWGKDLDYLKEFLIEGDQLPENCPDTPIDSEYLFIYLMELVKQNGGDAWSALYEWGSTLTNTITDDWNALNIVLTDGHIIWALRLSYRSDRFSLNYLPIADERGYAISTQALGPGWTPLPNFSLAEFRAGFLPYIEEIPRPGLGTYQAPYTVTNPFALKFQKPE